MGVLVDFPGWRQGRVLSVVFCYSALAGGKRGRATDGIETGFRGVLRGTRLMCIFQYRTSMGRVLVVDFSHETKLREVDVVAESTVCGIVPGNPVRIGRGRRMISEVRGSVTILG